MASRVLVLEKDYIVHKFYRGVDDAFFKTMSVYAIPTIIVFDQGKQVRRHLGITDVKKITDGVKTRKSQSIWYPDWLKLW